MKGRNDDRIENIFTALYFVVLLLFLLYLILYPEIEALHGVHYQCPGQRNGTVFGCR